jgi:hypothetical protein
MPSETTGTANTANRPNVLMLDSRRAGESNVDLSLVLRLDWLKGLQCALLDGRFTGPDPCICCGWPGGHEPAAVRIRGAWHVTQSMGSSLRTL